MAQALKASEEKIGQPITKALPTSGEARIEDEGVIEVPDRPVTGDKLALLKFMEEPVEVMVHRSADKFAKPIVEVWNDGTVQRFIRGTRIVVKRKYVEVLARSREIMYDQEVGIDRATGEAVQKMIPRIGLKYPFDVTRDENPRGRDWLYSLIQDA